MDLKINIDFHRFPIFISGDLEQHLMGMALVAGPAVAPNGGAVPRRLPDSPPVVVPQGGRSVGGARWRDWENGEELHSMAHPPPPLFAGGGQRVLQQQQQQQLQQLQQQQRAMSQDPADNAFWQRSAVRIFIDHKIECKAALRRAFYSVNACCKRMSQRGFTLPIHGGFF